MPALTLDFARQLLDQAMLRASQEFKRPICVSVCDHTGLLLAFARMDGAPFRSVAISQGKAYSAARMGTTTQAVLERLHREGIQVGDFCDPQLTSLPGGSPLKEQDGTLRGAIGVSGLTSEQDQQITDAIAKAFAA